MLEKNEIIASRTLYLISDKSKKIKIELGRPYRNKEFGDVACSYIITFPDGSISKKEGFGSDSIQAIILTLERIGATLKLYNEKKFNGELAWLGEPEPFDNFGFLYPKDVKEK